MVYQSKPRVMLDDIFGAFDCPDAGQVSPKRTVSTTPLQALNLLNSSFAVQQAGALADRVRMEVGDDVRKQVERLFLLAFGRSAVRAEMDSGIKLVSGYGLESLCRAVLNANEFLMVQ